MIGKCRYNTGSELLHPARGHFYSERTKFALTPGQDYRVAGLGIFETILLALVCDDTGKPNWLPVGLFDLEDMEVADSWHFAVRNGLLAAGGDPTGQWIAMWGYKELVFDPRHSEALIDREPEALAVFYRVMNLSK